MHSDFIYYQDLTGQYNAALEAMVNEYFLINDAIAEQKIKDTQGKNAHSIKLREKYQRIIHNYIEATQAVTKQQYEQIVFLRQKAAELQNKNRQLREQYQPAQYYRYRDNERARTESIKQAYNQANS